MDVVGVAGDGGDGGAVGADFRDDAACGIVVPAGDVVERIFHGAARAGDVIGVAGGGGLCGSEGLGGGGEAPFLVVGVAGDGAVRMGDLYGLGRGAATAAVSCAEIVADEGFPAERVFLTDHAPEAIVIVEPEAGGSDRKGVDGAADEVAVVVVGVVGGDGEVSGGVLDSLAGEGDEAVAGGADLAGDLAAVVVAVAGFVVMGDLHGGEASGGVGHRGAYGDRVVGIAIVMVKGGRPGGIGEGLFQTGAVISPVFGGSVALAVAEGLAVGVVRPGFKGGVRVVGAGAAAEGVIGVGGCTSVLVDGERAIEVVAGVGDVFSSGI